MRTVVQLASDGIQEPSGNNLVISNHFLTAPYAVPGMSLAMLFFDNGLSLSRARAVSCRVNLSHQLLFTPKGENKMLDKKHFTTEQAREIGDKLGIDWNRSSVAR